MKRHLCVLLVIIIVITLGLHFNNVTFFDYKGSKIGNYNAVICSEKDEKEYVSKYIVKIKDNKFILYVSKDIETLNYGAKINIDAEMQDVNKSRNYGGFSYDVYLKSQNICGVLKASKVKIISNDETNNLIQLTRKYIKNVVRENVKNNPEMIIGILLGDKSAFPEDIQEDFKGANLSHLLAVSGAHFTYIILIISIAMKWCKHKRLRQIITICFIVFFMMLTGNTPSVLRAGIMSIMLIVASMLKRKNDFWTTLGLSLLVQIIYNPYVIFNMGLVLSYSGTIGIVWFYSKIYNIIKIKTVSVALAANILLIPIMIFNFNTISFNFIISNVLSTGIFGAIIIMSFISIIFKFEPFFIILDILCSLLSKIAYFSSNIPFSHIYVPTYAVYIVLILYLLIFSIIKYKRKTIAILTATIVLASSILYSVSNKFDDSLYVNFIDVGQGDATLIRNRGINIMIDGGGSLDESYDVGKSIVFPYLLDRGVMQIDYMIISHFDADHCQGLIYVLNNLKVKRIIISKQAEISELYKKTMQIAKEKNVNVVYIRRGDQININNIKIDILHPEENLITDNPLNNNAIICKITYYDTKILFTGDVEAKGEETLKLVDVSADILKVGHHGSKTSTTEELLERIKPQVALIGVGKNNKFGHPNEDVINRLKNINCKIYRTDINGEISIKINKKNMKIKTMFS